MATTSSPLTPVQIDALFDILTHYETYAEVESIRPQDAVAQWDQSVKHAPDDDVLSNGITVGGDVHHHHHHHNHHHDDDAQKPDGNNEAVAVTAESNTATAATAAAAATVTKPDDCDSQDDDDDDDDIAAPILRLLHREVMTTLPGMRNMPADFWDDRFPTIMDRFYITNSYDKGTIGLRKTIAALTSAIVGSLARGRLGGCPRGTSASEGNQTTYDLTNAADLDRAWDDVMDGLVYGDLVDKLFDAFAESDQVEDYSPAVRAAVEVTIINLATFLHRIFVLSPEGQILFRLFENLHKMTPYTMMKQALRASNAATMINAMTKMMLAKLSLGGLSNWAGLTSNADDGMNLMQRIIWGSLSWDASEFRKIADQIEKAKDGPSEQYLAAIRAHVQQSREEHMRVRAISASRPESIVRTILTLPGSPSSNKSAASTPSTPAPELVLSEAHHEQCLAYYSALLSVRDRETLGGALSKQTPDLFTPITRDLVKAFDPLIRIVHSKVNFKEHFDNSITFLNSFFATGRIVPAGSKGEEQVPTVGDFVQLLRSERGKLFTFVHRVAKNCPGVWDEYRAWGKKTIHSYQASEESETLRKRLVELFAALPQEKQTEFIPALDLHAKYLESVKTLSQTRMQRVLDAYPAAAAAAAAAAQPAKKSEGRGPVTPSTQPKSFMAATSKTTTGPGMYLSRAQTLLDDTAITPSATDNATIRRGRDVREGGSRGRMGLVSSAAQQGQAVSAAEEDDRGAQLADVGGLVRELGGPWRGLVEEFVEGKKN